MFVRRRSTLLAALVTVGLIGCASDESKVSDFMARADEYVASESWNEAAIEYRSVLQLDPNHAAAHYGLAKAYLATNKLRDAYWELNETARLDPANLEARLTFGRMSVAAREYEDALVQADAILEVEPENGSAVVLRAQALEGLGRAEEAEASYLKARELAPDDSALLRVLAGYYERQKRREEAEGLLRRYAELEPGFVSHTTLARFLAQDRERDADALAAFRAALEGSEGDSLRNAYRNLSAFHFARGQLAEAESVLKEGIARDDESLELVYLLSRIYTSQGQAAKADALIEKAIAERPDDPEPHLVLSSYRGERGDLDGALEAAEAALALEPQNLQAKLRKAELLVDQGYRTGDSVKTAEGRSIVEVVLAREPSNAAALFVQSKSQMAEGDPAAAAESLRTVLDSRPDWAQAHFLLGSALFSGGDIPGARAELTRALELDPGIRDARRLVTQAHALLREHEYTIEQGKIYLRDVPDHVPTRILVAQGLARLGRAAEAIQEMEVVPADRRDANTYFALGRLRVANGELAEARQDLLRADALRPNHPQVLETLLRVDQQTGRLDESVARIRKAAQAEPTDAHLVRLMGTAGLMSGDLAAAERDLKRAIELDPNELSPYEQLAGYYRATGQLDKTIATYEDAVEANPANPQLHVFLAMLYESAGDQAQAITEYSRALELDRRMGAALNNLAYLLAEEGQDLDRALDLAQEAKALMPDSPHAADTLGWVLYKRGIPSAAVGYLREAEAGMDPTDATLGVTRRHLALAYEANGDSEQAIASLERALEDLRKQSEAVRAAGGEPGEPGWAPEARAMLERLRKQATG